VKQLYVLFKIFVGIDFISSFIWFINDKPFYIFFINFIFTSVSLLAILFLKQKQQINFLIYIFIVRSFFTPILTYYKYSSIGISLLSILISILFIGFLFKHREDYNYI